MGIPVRAIQVRQLPASGGYLALLDRRIPKETSVSAEEMARLTQAAADDPTIAERINGASSLDEVLILASDLGYAVTAGDFEAARGEQDQLSEAELEQASGGFIYTTFTLAPRC